MKQKKPKQYQIDANKTIDEKFDGRCLIAADMGLGKSLMSLLRGLQYPDKRPIVIVCPASLKWQWRHEILTWTGERAEILTGQKSRKLGRRFKSPFYIVNYDILNFWVPRLLELEPQILIADEIQLLTNRKTLRTCSTNELAQNIPDMIALSGTPIIHRHADLYPILYMLYPEKFPSFTKFGWKFCLPADAPITMADFSKKSISEIKPGDMVLGWTKEPIKRKQKRITQSKVLDVLRLTAPLQEIHLENGAKLICTPDHQWAAGRRVGSPHEFLTAKTGRLRGGGRGAATRIMKVVDPTKPEYPENDHYKLGYIHGFFRGDGSCIRKRPTKEDFFKKTRQIQHWDYNVSCANMDLEPMERIHSYLNDFQISHVFARGNTGKIHKIRMLHKQGFDFIVASKRNSNAWWAGFLGGIYDAKGSGLGISQYFKVNPITYRMIVKALTKFDFRFKQNKTNLWMYGGRNTLLRFWNITNPTLVRKLITEVYRAGPCKFHNNLPGGSTGFEACPKVVKIKPLNGLHETYTLTTETGNYVAYGYGSKNCKPTMQYGQWKFNGSVNSDLLRKRLLKYVMIRIRRADVVDQLPVKRRTVVPLDLKDRKQYDEAVNDFRGWLVKHKPSKLKSASGRAAALVKIGYLRRLAAKLKMRAAEEWIDNFLAGTDEKIVLFGVHRKILDRLMKRYGDVAVRVDGSVTGHRRQLAVEKFQKDERCRVFIGQIKAAGVGLNLDAARTVAFLELPWSPGDLAQAEDRCYARAGNMHGAEVYYLLGRETVEASLCKLLRKKHRIISAVLDNGKGAEDFDVLTRLMEIIQTNPTEAPTW